MICKLNAFPAIHKKLSSVSYLVAVSVAILMSESFQDFEADFL